MPIHICVWVEGNRGQGNTGNTEDMDRIRHSFRFYKMVLELVDCGSLPGLPRMVLLHNMPVTVVLQAHSSHECSVVFRSTVAIKL